MDPDIANKHQLTNVIIDHHHRETSVSSSRQHFVQKLVESLLLEFQRQHWIYDTTNPGPRVVTNQKLHDWKGKFLWFNALTHQQLFLAPLSHWQKMAAKQLNLVSRFRISSMLPVTCVSSHA